MLYVLWYLFAIAVFFGFIFLCIKSIGLVRKEYGIGAAILLTVGMLATCNGDNNKQPDAAKWSNREQLKVIKTVSGKIRLDKNPLFSIYLFYDLGHFADSRQTIPIKAFATVKGLVGPVSWKPESLSVYYDSSNTQMMYQLNGAIQYKLLNFPVITTYKNYEGTLPLTGVDNSVK